jgi:hypothetical protein
MIYPTSPFGEGPGVRYTNYTNDLPHLSIWRGAGGEVLKEVFFYG